MTERHHRTSHTKDLLDFGTDLQHNIVTERPQVVVGIVQEDKICCLGIHHNYQYNTLGTLVLLQEAQQ